MIIKPMDLRPLLLRVVGVAFLITLLELPPLVKSRFCSWCQDQEETQSFLIQVIVVISRLFFVVTSLPFAVLNFAGLITLCFFPTRRITTKNSPLLAPFICFRVVTRGLFPELVQNNVEMNTKTCLKSGLAKFMFEVVTDRPLYLRKNKYTLEQVVPPYYQTQHNSLFKARALHYCNEPEINQLSPNDWIVHLDEETVLTEDSVIGILNFVSTGDADFGQGAITYASGRVVNWLTTLIDGNRVGFDYCYLRFALNVLRRPFFNWKGSYMVARAGAEHDVSFDNGVEGSIAEDCFFGAVATSKGYKFGFIEGDMMEESVYTVADFIRQRKRWDKGAYLTVCSRKIPIRHKLGLMLSSFSIALLPFMAVGTALDLLTNVPRLHITGLVMRFIQVIYTYVFVFGSYTSMKRSRYHPLRRAGISLLATLIMPLCVGLEAIASIWHLMTLGDIDFYIVQKRSGICLKDSGALI